MLGLRTSPAQDRYPEATELQHASERLDGHSARTNIAEDADKQEERTSSVILVSAPAPESGVHPEATNHNNMYNNEFAIPSPSPSTLQSRDVLAIMPQNNLAPPTLSSNPAINREIRPPAVVSSEAVRPASNRNTAIRKTTTLRASFEAHKRRLQGGQADGDDRPL